MLPLRAITEAERASCLSTAVYRTIQEAVLSGQLRPNAVLSEVAIAKQLNVSRTPVHDALRQLAKDGLVEQNTGRRARVTKLDVESLFETFEVRKLLEGHAAELAAGRIDHSQLLPMYSEAEQLLNAEQNPAWFAKMNDYDDRFHMLIGKAAGNRFLQNDIARYRLLQNGFKTLEKNQDAIRNGLRDHLRILDALQVPNGALAKQAMVQHIRGLQEQLIKSLAN